MGRAVGMRLHPRALESKRLLRSNVIAILAVCAFLYGLFASSTHHHAEVQQAPRRLSYSFSNSSVRTDAEEKSDTKRPSAGVAALNAFGMCYMFLALAIVCDEFFVPALEVMSSESVLNLSPDIAGATFMAAGGSAPEFFTSMIGTLRPPPSDVGIATIVGSAVFNVLFVIGACGIASKKPLKLTWYPLARDSLFYIVHLACLVAFFYDGQILWWEALIQFFLYVAYCVYMKYSGRVERYLKGSRLKAQSTEDMRKEFDQIDTNQDGVIDDSEARAAGVDREFDDMDADQDHKITFQEFAHYRRSRHQMRKEANKATRAETKGAAQLEEANDEEGDDENKDDEEEERPVELCPPAGVCGGKDDSSESDDADAYENAVWGPKEWIYYVLSLPIVVALYFTVPDVRRGNCWQKLWALTFILSIIWIAAFSFVMVYCAEKVGAWTQLDTRILALTFIAAGTSVPDLLTSVIVTLQGHGDMAISSSIGSNIFDVTVGLPVPWLLAALISQGEPVKVNSKPLTMFIQIGALILMLAFTIGSIMLCGRKLNKNLGFVMLVLYVGFMVGVIYQIMQE